MSIRPRSPRVSLAETTTPAPTPAAAPTTTLVDLLRYRAETDPEGWAYAFIRSRGRSEVRLSYAQVDERARAIASRLQTLARPGDRVLLLHPPGLDFVTAFFGCLYSGMVAVPAYPPVGDSGDARLHSIVRDAEPRVVLTLAGMVAATRKVLGAQRDRFDIVETDGVVGDPERWRRPDLEPGALAFLQYTSGSTGSPKGVMIQHRHVMANEELIKLAFDHVEPRVQALEAAGACSGVGVSWLPTYHDMGLIGHVLQALYVGRPNILLSPIDFMHRPMRWLEAISKYRAHTSGAPNFAFASCAEKARPEVLDRLDLSCWRVAYSGAEPVRAETLERFAEVFGPCGFDARAFLPCYGLAEATLFVTGADVDGEPVVRDFSASAMERGELSPARDGRDLRRLVSCGRPRLDTKVRIVRPDTREACPDGGIGEIWVSGPAIAEGYWSDADDRDQRFHARVADGDPRPYLRTGDLGGVVDSELFVTGRLKEVVIIRGRNLYPQDVEAAAQESHPDLQAGAGAAFGVDAPDGERLVLVQEIRRVARDRIRPDRVAEAVRGAVASRCGVGVAEVVLVPPRTIPKTSSGKIQRLACRRAYLAGSLPSVQATQCDPPAIDAVEATRPDPPAIEAVQAPPAAREQTQVPPDLLASIQQFLRRRGMTARALPAASLRSDVGLDSLGIFELVSELEEEFDAPIDPDRLAELETVGDVAAAVQAARKGGAGVDSGLAQLRDRILDRIPQLRARVAGQRGRRVKVEGRWIDDFASANYLGVDLDEKVMASIGPAVERWGVHPSWTRIVASPEIYEDLESRIASFIGAREVLVFPTVTLAHVGLLPLLTGSGGAVLVDSHAHNSIQEAARLATTRGAEMVTFDHNDPRSLESALVETRDRSRRIIAIDGVYSMSSDYPPLPELVALAREHDARLYIDDAHGIGVVGEAPSLSMPYGHRGNGIVRYFDLDYAEDAIVYVGGMSKAFSSLAAFVTCVDEAEKRRFCEASTMVFSGPCPTASLASALAAIDICDSPEGERRRRRLAALTQSLVDGARRLGFEVDNNAYFPLVGVVVGGIFSVIRACDLLWEEGILITPAMFPAVALDRGLLRFTLTSANDEGQIERALAALRRVRDEIGVSAAREP